MLIYIIMSRPFRQSTQLPLTISQSSTSENAAVLKLGALYESTHTTTNIETVGVKALFNNGNAVNAIDASGSGFTLGHTGTPSTKYSFTTVATDDIQIIPNEDLPYNSIVTVSRYVPTNLDVSYNTSSDDDVTVRSDLSVQKTSSVDASSSAYMDATVKITFVDQYLQDNHFYDSSDTWEANFDISSNYVPTRNVNSQTAHTDSSAGVSVTDLESWNTQGNFGPFYVEGDVSIDSYGKPIKTAFTDTSKKLSSYTDYTVELVSGTPTPTPVFGRYAAQVITANVYKVISSGTLLDSSDTVTSNLYSALTSDIDPSFNDLLVESNIPVVVGASNAQNPLSDYVLADTSLQPGFDLHITSSVHSSAIDLINNSLANPFSIDTTDMSFAPVNMYALQNAVDANNILNNYGYTDNYVEIINGSLDLSGVNASNSSLSLGTDAEYLTIGESDNGYVTFPSVNVISGISGEETYPRASKTLFTDSDHFNQLVVRYEDGDDSHTEVGVIGTSLKTATDVSYNIQTILTNTISSNTDYSSLSGYIGLSNESIALVTQTNSTITPSAITYNNTNTVYDEPLYIIDFECQKNWMQNNLYDASGNVALSNASFSASGTNTSTSTSTFRDLRIQLDAKTVGDLTAISNGWSLSCDDSYLSSSNEFESCLQSSDIQSLLGGDISGSLAITFGPAEATSISASKLVQFNDKLTFTYNGHSSVTYNDEFFVTTTSSAVSSATILQSAYTGIPSGCVLNKKLLTTAFTVKTPFRLGAYTNLNITTPEITKIITYYTLTKDGVELPRRLLANIIETGVGEITSTVNAYSTTTDYALTANDLKPYSISLQKTVDDSNWIDFFTPYSADITYSQGDIVSFNNNYYILLLGGASNQRPDLYTALWEIYYPTDADMWYGTQTSINSSIGNFTFNFSFPITIYSLNVARIYGDLSLEKGTNTFTVAGKSFTSSNILDNNMNTFNFATASIPTNYGNVLSLDSPTYNITSLDNNAPGTATLSSSGYSFTYSNNLLLNLRVVVAKQTLFSVTRTVDGSGSNYIKTIDEIGVLPLDTGIYTQGGLTNTHRGDYAIWSLNNDYASVKLYNGYTMSTSEIERTETVNGAYLDASNTILKSRGVTFNWNRGYSVGTTDIVRTATRVVFDIAGYSLGSYSTDYYLYYGQVRTPFGGLQITDQLSMYPAEVTAEQYWDLELSSYGTYNISYKNNGDPSSNYTVPAYNFIIWQGVTKSFVNNTLNTISFDYRMTYDPVEVDFYRIEDYTSTSTTISDYGTKVATYNENDLKDPTSDNIIGNVLNIHVGASAALVDILVFFSICPPFISFKAIDPSTISNIPFTPQVDENYITYYKAVDTSSNTYNPFSSSSNINNITFTDTRDLSYLDFFSDASGATQYDMIIDNYNFIVEMKQGLSAVSSTYTQFYDGLIQANSSNANYLFGSLDASGEFRVELNQLNILTGLEELSNNVDPSSNFDLYNLKMTIGSAFINNGTEIYLEFVSGEAVSHTTYAIDEVSVQGGSMNVTIAKYLTDSNLSIQHLNLLLYNGQNLAFTSKYTSSFTKSIPTALPGSKTIRDEFLASIATTITDSSFNWTASTGVTPGSILKVLPLTENALIQIIKMYAVSKNIPVSVTVLDLPDQLETRDKSGNLISRITYNGRIESDSLSLNVRNALLPFN